MSEPSTLTQIRAVIDDGVSWTVPIERLRAILKDWEQERARIASLEAEVERLDELASRRLKNWDDTLSECHHLRAERDTLKAEVEHKPEQFETMEDWRIDWMATTGACEQLTHEVEEWRARNKVVDAINAQMGDDLDAEGSRFALMRDERDALTARCETLEDTLSSRKAELCHLRDKACARCTELEGALEGLLGRVGEMPDPHSNPMRHYFNQLAVWKDDARAALKRTGGEG